MFLTRHTVKIADGLDLPEAGGLSRSQPVTQSRNLGLLGR
jgi:hypothetical protein